MQKLTDHPPSRGENGRLRKPSDEFSSTLPVGLVPTCTEVRESNLDPDLEPPACFAW